MTGCVALRKDVYYVRLSYYDKDHIRKDKFVSTGLSGRGAKQKAIKIKTEKKEEVKKEENKVCSQCGLICDASSKFCTKCGFELK